MWIPVHSPGLPGYIHIAQTVLVILTVAGLFPEHLAHQVHSSFLFLAPYFLPFMSLVLFWVLNVLNGLLFFCHSLKFCCLWGATPGVSNSNLSQQILFYFLFIFCQYFPLHSHTDAHQIYFHLCPSWHAQNWTLIFNLPVTNLKPTTTFIPVINLKLIC